MKKDKKLEIKIRRLRDVTLPKKIDIGDWIDLRSPSDFTLSAGDCTNIPLGFAMELPKGYEAHVVPRSSTFNRYGVIQTNGMGVIDNSYCGGNDEWKMQVFSLVDGKISKNDRICQFRIVKSMPEVEISEVEYFNNKNRGGFGATGRN